MDGQRSKRLACLCVTESIKTTPMSAMGFLLNLPSLYRHIQRASTSVTYSLIQNQTPVIQIDGEIQQKLIKELKSH